MTEREKIQRLYDDRIRLFQKLDHIGYVPDDDMRSAIEQIVTELQARILMTRDELLQP